MTFITRTLIESMYTGNEDNLLTERIEAATKYECIKRGSVPSLQRATRYLLASQEAIRRYANRIQMVEDYDEAESNYEPWVLVNTKQELMNMAIRNRKTYDNCYAYYKQILLKEITK